MYNSLMSGDDLLTYKCEILISHPVQNSLTTALMTERAEATTHMHTWRRQQRVNRTWHRAMKINEGIVLDCGRNVMGKLRYWQVEITLNQLQKRLRQTEHTKIVQGIFFSLIMIPWRGNFRSGDLMLRSCPRPPRQIGLLFSFANRTAR